MSYKFFAAEADKIALLEFLFSKTNLQVFDSYSPLGQTVRQYKCLADVTSAFDLKIGSQFAVTLQLWSPNFDGKISFPKIKLNPKYCQGHTFRYQTAGWGLIQLYFGGEQNGILHHSHLGNWSERGALAAADKQDEAEITSWNWREINRVSRQIRYFIHQKMAVAKLGSLGILPDAQEQIAQGIALSLK
ncbi:MAG: hypothetical protein ACRYFX_28320 [Janthinobacterium lividum]